MEINEIQKFIFHMENEQRQIILKGEIEGQSEVPGFDDIKFKGVLALLNSIDKQNFSESGNNAVFDQYLMEVEETINEMKKYNRFQDNTGCREGL
ncbi:hypothetical protein [Psychrobacillus sp. FJAT-21963]|uniref:hypothetical protein n=1 Tax=Psychrobacillus sp. FJAT-21963 TaxID=1712028 RepID=UPI0006F3F48E|nr:hypothetical protein [Psychrobacillus sp. FJAT-21963]KQL35305.1 hypothetical protein AN959_10255 [Psychrobacillus sp. FJAT-21963]